MPRGVGPEIIVKRIKLAKQLIPAIRMKIPAIHNVADKQSSSVFAGW
jgi:hypothetical protein